jgi:hypothetical protein
MKTFALSLLAVSILSAQLFAQAPAPAPVTPPAPPPGTVPGVIEPLASIEGPKQVLGTFMLLVKSKPKVMNTWRNVLPDGAVPPVELELKNGDLMLWFQDPKPGVYLFRLRSQLESPKLDQVTDVEHTVTVGPVQPTPTPTPTPPTPTPPPVVEGARHVIIVYETADVTPAFARTLNGLRSGSSGKYFDDNKHTLSLIDDDAVAYSGEKAALLEKYAKDAKYDRSCIVTDAKTGAVINVMQLTDATTDANIVEFVKQNGG